MNIVRRPDLRTAVVGYRIRNTTTSTLVLTSLGVRLDFARGADDWRVCSCACGQADAGYPSNNYQIREQLLLGSGAIRLGTDLDGRSSNRNLPMVILLPGGSRSGFWCGPAWSGEWNLTVEQNATSGQVSVTTSIGIRRLRLNPGEELVFPDLHLGMFDGDLADGSNALRRYIVQGLQPLHRGRPPVSQVWWCSFNGFGNDIDEAEMLRQAEAAASLGIEVFEIDAGYAGNFPGCSGEWGDVDRRKFPRGLEPIADRARALGMEFGLWVDPERALRGTWSHSTRPDIFWPDPAGRDEFHLDLSRREAQDWLIGWVSDWVGRLGVRHMRWDQNAPSGIYFNNQDWTRKVQFAYVQGLYRVLDELGRKFPDLMIQNCASGGRRIDFGTLSRTQSDWMCDYTDDAHTCRWMQLRAQRFLPGNRLDSGIGHLSRHHLADGLAMGGVAPEGGRAGLRTTRDIDLDFISRITGMLDVDGDIASLDQQARERYRHWIAIHKAIRHLTIQDFHELLPIPQTPEQWDAAQWSAYDRDEGLIACFRVAGPVSGHIPLKTLDPRQTYGVTDLSDGAEREYQGVELLSQGLPVSFAERNAILCHWRVIRPSSQQGI
jgi:alpha-galactosidase